MGKSGLEAGRCRQGAVEPQWKKKTESETGAVFISDVVRLEIWGLRLTQKISKELVKSAMGKSTVEKRTWH